MARNIMDTQDLSEIRKMISGSSFDEEDYSLEDILAEAGGKEVREGKQRRIEHIRPPVQEDADTILSEVRQFTAPKPKAAPRPAAQPEMPARREEAPQIKREAPFVSQPPSPAADIQKILEEKQQGTQAGGKAAARTSAQAAAPVRPKPALKIVEQPLSAPTFEDPWEDEEPENPKARRKQEKKARKAEKKARRAAMDDFDDEEEQLKARDPNVAMRSGKRRARGLTKRSIPVFLLFLGTTYLSVAGGAGWPLPEILNYAESTMIAVLTMVVMQFLAMLIGLDVIGRGIYAIFNGGPDRSTLAAVSCFASIAHGLTIILMPAWGGYLPYCAVSILVLFAVMQENRARLTAKYRTFKACTIVKNPYGVAAHYDKKEEIWRAVKTRVREKDDFLIEIDRADSQDTVLAVYAPVALAACIIFALIVSVGLGEPTRFFWALSALLSVCAPIGVVCAAGKAQSNVARRLLTQGGAIPSVRAARRLRKVKQALLGDSDLFPAGSITIEQTKNYGNYSVEKLLAYAAAVTNGQGLEIGRVFSEALKEQYGRPVKANNVLQYDSGGLSADIAGDSVLVGTAAFLINLGMHVRDIHGMENGVFVVINNQVAGVFNLMYHPSAQTYGALHGLGRMRIKPVLATRDFNITAAMVESLFELRNGTTLDLDGAQADRMTSAEYTAQDEPSGILSHGGATSYVQLLQGAEKLAGAVLANLSIGIFSGVCGMFLVFYLTYVGAAEAIQPKNILLYLILWAVPAYFITQSTKKKF